MQQDSNRIDRKNKELLKYDIRYMGGYPGFRRHRNGYFKIIEDEIRFLFTRLLYPPSKSLHFPMGSVTGIDMSQEDVVNRSGYVWLLGRFPVLKTLRVMKVTFTDIDGQEQVASFVDCASLLFVNELQKAFDILVAERKRYQSRIGV